MQSGCLSQNKYATNNAKVSVYEYRNETFLIHDHSWNSLGEDLDVLLKPRSYYC